MALNKKILALAAVAITTFAGMSAAHAQSSRMYFAGYMGLNTFSGMEFSESAAPAGGDLEYSNTTSFAGALGLRLSPAMRLEGEVSYRNADVSSMSLDDGNIYDSGGNLRTYLFMLNAYYDFDLQWNKITPFVSAGVGLAYHDGEIHDASGLASNATGSDVGLAYQVGGGLKYRWDDNLALTGGYRYLGGSDIEFDNYNFDYSSHEIRFGLEYDIPVDFMQ